MITHASDCVACVCYTIGSYVGGAGLVLVLIVAAWAYGRRA